MSAMQDGGVSVVVPAYRADRTIDRCVRSLLAQEIDRPFEVIVIASADRAEELPRLPADPRLNVERHVPRVPAAVARNRGAAAARGELIAFTDADVVAAPGWLAGLADASGGRLCVAGAVVNGTPDSAFGTAEYLLEFLDLHPARPSRTAWHGATCNLLVPRTLWQRFGPFPEDMRGGEDTLLTVKLREYGLFTFAADARASHLNRSRPREVFSHQYEFGLFTAQLARRSRYKLRPLVSRWPLAPIAAGARLASIYVRVAAWLPGERRRAAALLPLVVGGLCAFGAGLLVEGYRLDRGDQERPATPELPSE